MRPVVAIVEARPETILEDYRRVYDLAQLGQDPAAEPVLAAAAYLGRWLPGFTSPPWQLDGVLAALEQVKAAAGVAGLPADAAVPVVAVGARGRRDRLADPAHDAVLLRRGAFWAGEAAAELLARRPALLLPVPVLVTGGGLAGATSLLADLLSDFMEVGPDSDAARDILPRLGVVMDAVLWGADAGTLKQGCIQRNVLLAGKDPVAVDAVALRLAGGDPLRAGGLRAWQDAGLGVCDPDQVRVVGHVELLQKTFAGHRHAGAHKWPKVSGPALRAAAWNVWRRPRVLRAHAATPWGRLAGEYRHGVDGGRSR